MKFLIDNQLPLALARFIASCGHESQHVLDVGLARESDQQIWKYASDNGCVLVSKDEDFFHLTNRPEAGVKLVWVRLGNCRTAVLLAEFERLWSRIEASLKAGDRTVELR